MMPDKIVRGSSLGCNDVLHYMKQIDTRPGSEDTEENLSTALPLTQTVSADTYLLNQVIMSSFLSAATKLLVSQRCHVWLKQ